MIIRATFKDNHFTEVLEKYFDDFGYINYYLNISDENYRKEEKKLKKAVFKPEKMTKEEIKALIDQIKNSIEMFIAKFYNEHLEYLKDTIYLEIVPYVEDKWENGEVVYFFLSKQQYVGA